VTTAALDAAAVLMYHSVCNGPTNPLFRQYVLAPAFLERQLAALAEAGFTVDSSVHATGGPPATRSVVLTFDDGFRDFYDVVLPMLERYRMRASLFIPTGYIGGTAVWLSPEGESTRPILDAAQLRDIAASKLVDVGAHSHAPPPLDIVDAARRAAEIRLPRLILEDLLQTPVTTFAYPFGYFNGAALREVAAADYRLAYAVGERHVTTRDHCLAIPRWSVGPDLEPLDLVRLVRSSSPVAAALVTGIKRHLWRQQRRFAHSPVAPASPPPTIQYRKKAITRESS
jgi:peptidoglycan/xylan/chitin deacetylase (PgdA/CDA1 family)